MKSLIDSKRKKTASVTAFLFSVTIILSGTSLLVAGDTDDARDFYNKMYAQAVSDLQHGDAHEKINAARLMGAHKLTHFMRLLGEELIKDIDHPTLRRTTTNDAYIKSTIAWSLGQIGHRWSYPYLIEALDKTMVVAEFDVKTAEAKAEKAKASSSPEAVLIPTRPTPALMAEGFKYPASPDYNWSVADEMKSYVGLDTSDEGLQMRLIGYNRVNQAMSILTAMGDIGSQNGIYFKSLNPTPETEKIMGSVLPIIQKNLEHPLSEIRGAAAMALGGIGTKSSLEILKGRFNAESDYRVKVRIARAVLMNDKSQHVYFDFLLNMLPNNDMYVRRESAIALRELSMGESVFALGDAIEVEENEQVRHILQEAEYNARIDNILPVNY